MSSARLVESLPLWQGDKRAAATADAKKLDLLVVAAQELRPIERLIAAFGHGIAVYDAGIDDATLSPREARIAEDAAHHVAEALGRGRRVLVACFAGRNRSGLVSGLVLKRLGYSAGEAIAIIRAARGPDALSNTSFVRYLEAK